MVFISLTSAAGISRSVSFVIAYLMKENMWKYDEAYNFVKSKRKTISPNSGFIQQLMRYEVTLGITKTEELNELIRNKKFVKELSIFSEDDE